MLRPTGDPGLWDVTNGLLAHEMIRGGVQLGDDTWRRFVPADLPVAGDADDANSPRYASFTTHLDDPPVNPGVRLVQVIRRDGTTTFNSDMWFLYGVTAAVTVPETQHTIASPFWDFMNSSGTVYANPEYPYGTGEYVTDRLFENPFYATGYPITEAYWSKVVVNGERKDVLMQCFERRCLTYTPANTSGWQVEAGNVGQHYALWRQGELGYGLGQQIGGNLTGLSYTPTLMLTFLVKRPVDIVVDMAGIIIPGRDECYEAEFIEALTDRLVLSDLVVEFLGDEQRFWLDDGTQLLSEWLVRNGYARMDWDNPDLLYLNLIHAADAHARDAGLGIWGACDL